MCRCSTALENSVKEKISMFCHVEPEQVICVHDVSSIYRVPLLLEDQGVVGYLSRRLNMPIETRPRKMLTKWKEMSDRRVFLRGQRVNKGNRAEKCSLAVFFFFFCHMWSDDFPAEKVLIQALQIPTCTLSPQVRQAARALLYSTGREVHQVFRLLRFRHQGTGALGPGH